MILPTSIILNDNIIIINMNNIQIQYTVKLYKTDVLSLTLFKYWYSNTTHCQTVQDRCCTSVTDIAHYVHMLHYRICTTGLAPRRLSDVKVLRSQQWIPLNYISEIKSADIMTCVLMMSADGWWSPLTMFFVAVLLLILNGALVDFTKISLILINQSVNQTISQSVNRSIA